MYDNFIFSLGSALPIFLVMFMGYILKRRNIVDESFVRQANTMVFNLALPIKLFSDVSKTSFAESFDWGFILFVVIGTVVSVLIAAVFARFSVKNPAQKAAFIQGSFRGNFLYVGYSLMENVMGSVGTKAPIAIAFIVPLYNILAVMLFSYYGTEEKSEANLKSVGMKILKNPLIIAIIIGFVFSSLNLSMPMVVERTFSYFSVLVTPLALLTIGASFKFQKIRESFGISLIASMLKLVILPLIAVYFALQLGFQAEELLVIYIIFGVPTAAASYIMTIALKGDHDLASGIIMLTTLLSNVTMTLFIFGFKTLGIL